MEGIRLGRVVAVLYGRPGMNCGRGCRQPTIAENGINHLNKNIDTDLA